MALIAPQPVTQAGLGATYTAVNASDTFLPGDGLMLHVKTAGTIITVTVVSPSTVACQLGATGSAHNLVVTMPATGDRMIGPLPAARFADPTTGLVTVTYSPTTAGTAALVQVS